MFESVPNDLYTSIVVGIIATLVAINLPRFNLLKEQVTEDNVEISREVEATLEKSPHLKKFFGVAVSPPTTTLNSKDTNAGTSISPVDSVSKNETVLHDNKLLNPPLLKEVLQNIADDELDEDDFMTMCVGWILTFGMTMAFLFAVNLVSKGEVGRMIAGMFPVETTALGIKQMLERL